MEYSIEVVNRFLSEIFGDILKREEATLAAGDLSLREVQLIDAICRTVDEGGDNRATAIASARQMPAGTLTCAVGLLEKKGYLVRRRDEKDRRAVRLLPTQQGRAASEQHRAFHRRLIDRMFAALTDQEASALVRGVEKLSALFRGSAQTPAEPQSKDLMK